MHVLDLGSDNLTYLIVVSNESDNLELQGRDRGRSIWENLGFDASFIKEARGYSSGIWCLWDPSIWKVDIIFHNHQLVHMMVTNGVSTP
ncbi:hypothetical protein Ahy_A03g014088 [Arachis hypogaea]|uniref:Uncharacterized protein n=1 Tax=Arachis hypogaea TaxID=3818 RepID=A0A445DWY6_ARAHY|nr:hypothetical protein Ahy_A03g014088 [Arachis hypogaea]